MLSLHACLAVDHDPQIHVMAAHSRPRFSLALNILEQYCIVNLARQPVERQGALERWWLVSWLLQMY